MVKIESKECEKIENDIRLGKSETEVSVPFSRFPMKKWMEWWNDCQNEYNGSRWMKAYSDHLKAKNSEENSAVWKRIAELEEHLAILIEKSEQPQEPKKEEKEGVKNLHGEVIS